MASPPGPAIAPLSVGVMGSGTVPHAELAHPLGELLARLGVNLVTGGGGGAMRAAAAAYVQIPRQRGISIGIIPCASLEERGHPLPGYPNEFVELPIYTHLPLSGEAGTSDLSRNHINVLTSRVVVALPGQAGTASEVALALRYGKPVLVFAPDDLPLPHFPPEAPRARSIEHVAAFLRDHGVP